MKSMLEIYMDKFEGKAKLIFERAIANTKALDQNCVSSQHVLYAFAIEEPEVFESLCKLTTIDAGLVANLARREAELGEKYDGPGLKVSTDAIELFKKSMERAKYHGRNHITTVDLLDAMVKLKSSPFNQIGTVLGLEYAEIMGAAEKLIRDLDYKQKQVASKYDVPASLQTLGVSLNKLASEGKLPPVIGREKEIRKVIEILCHKQRPNSALLIGDPGVGKTAVVEGLANMIENDPDSLPEQIKDINIIQIDMGSVVAGTMLRGMFEERMKDIIDELRENEKLVLFIDEAHMIVGSGTSIGFSSDGANMFKSAMSRGQLRIIGATTTGEYKEYIAEDPAFDRRFRKVTVDEPDSKTVREMLVGIKENLRKNYNVEVTQEAIDAAIDLAPRYMRHMKMPDKVIGWLDTACVKVNIEGSPSVGAPDVYRTVAEEARIPEDMVYRNTFSRFENMENKIADRIVGQKDAVKALAKRLKLNKGPLKDNYAKPDGVLMFLGPTGVGKTELAKALSEYLFGDEGRMIRVDMSEYGEGTVGIEKLIGMPRGIVGSERGGVLTEQLKENPYTVVLLDEVEKANPHLMNLFLQAFDEGWLTDGRGKKVYLSEAIVIMTSNIGSDNFKKFEKPMGFSSTADKEVKQAKAAVMKDFEQKFSPEFRNRLDEVIVFSPLEKDEVREIAVKYIDRMISVMTAKGKRVIVTQKAYDMIAEKGFSQTYGARFLKRYIDDQVKLPITEKWDSGSDFIVDASSDGILVHGAEYPQYV